MNQVPSVTLQTAVLMTVKEFANNQQKFSVHDITRTIRQKTGQGDLEIPEVEVAGGSFRFDIPHAKVKALFDELWRTGVFDPDFTLSRQFNGVYFEYTPALVNVVSVTSQQPAPVVAPFATTPASVPTVAVPPATSPLATNVQTRVSNYLANCKIRNFRPTLKQVQSAVKRDECSSGFSCADLKTFITSTLGYTVVDDPESLSRAQVATV